MPNKPLVLVAAAVLEARDQPSTYSSRRPGRQVPTIVDHVVSFSRAATRPTHPHWPFSRSPIDPKVANVVSEALHHIAGGEVSPMGRTRTFPSIGAPADRLRFAFASCQHYGQGFFTAYDAMNAGRSRPDRVPWRLHLRERLGPQGALPAAAPQAGAQLA
jgi:hypothetical protein